MNMHDYQPVTAAQRDALQRHGCTADDWSLVRVAEDFDPDRVRRVRFAGQTWLSRLSGNVADADGFDRPALIADACLVDCRVAPDVRIVGVRLALDNYHIETGACIEDVGLLAARPGAAYGNGVRVAAINEGGGREVPLFPDLSAQWAYLTALLGERPRCVARLSELAQDAAQAAIGQPATIGAGAVVQSSARIVDVQIGSRAVVRGAALLENGTILSHADAPTEIGAGVIARDFLIAEGARVLDGALLERVFVGQGCRVGKQFSAENSLFFANCEAFHGEACSVFAGPYSVTHHKGTLLIAGMFSFYNAGSSTNQSNHMYKLGPVHEGKLERGCKTGSFSYLMWPCRVGPFSVVLGKHTRPIDTRDFPFSHLEATPDGRCEMTPGLYLSTVGTVRDGAKWPLRDRRRGPSRRDRIDFDVLSPFTVGRMLRGLEKLVRLQAETPRTVRNVTIDGAEIHRLLLRTGIKFYQLGIELYLLEQLAARVSAQGGTAGEAPTTGGLTPASDAEFSAEWVDVAGQLMPRRRLDALADAIEEERLDSAPAVEAELDRIHEAYARDEWAWSAWALERHFEVQLAECTRDGLAALVERGREQRRRFLNLVLADAEKEFAEASRTGFGLGDADSRDADFAAVRGAFDGNRFVQEIRRQLEELS